MRNATENYRGFDIFATAPHTRFRFWSYGPAGMVRANTIEEARAKIDADLLEMQVDEHMDEIARTGTAQIAPGLRISQV